MNAWWIAWKNVRRNQRRSLVTIFIAAVGCAAIQIGGGFMLFTYQALIDGTVQEFGHLTVAHHDHFDKDEESPLQYGLTQVGPLIDGLEHLPQVRWVLPRVNLSGLISNGDKSVVFVGTGVDLAAESTARGAYLQLVEGGFKQVKRGAHQVVLGVDLARSLGAHVGSNLTLLATTTAGSMNAIDVEVIAIASSGWREMDKQFLYTGLDTAQQLLMSDRISTISLYFKDTATTPALREQLMARDGSHVYKPWWEQALYYHAVRALYNRVFGLLGFIIAALVFFSVANTLAMAVVERTREIGTFRAQGASPGEVVAQFIREGCLIGMTGAVIGSISASLIAWLLPYTGIQMPPPPGRSVGYTLRVDISPGLYLGVILAIALLCAGAAWFVSHRAARKPIVEALTHV